METIRERVYAWALRELEDVKRVPVSLVLAFAIGVVGGWLASQWFYAERIEALELRLEAALSNVPVSRPTPTVITRAVWRSAAFWAVLAIMTTVCILLFRSKTVIRRDKVALVGRVDSLQDQLRHESKQRERLREERDKAIAEAKDAKVNLAMCIFEAYEKTKLKDPQPRVTVRFAKYDQDYEIAQKTKGVFEQYVKWPVELEGSNKPALPRAERFKVVFDVGQTFFTYANLVHVISEGDFLGVPVGKKEFSEREDTHHLIALVLPSTGAEPLSGVEQA